MNLPLTAIVLAIVGLFMNLKTPPGTMKEKLRRMDWSVPLSFPWLHLLIGYDLLRIGNLVFIPSISCVYSLIPSWW
jgi:hypothetical protein